MNAIEWLDWVQPAIHRASARAHKFERKLFSVVAIALCCMMSAAHAIPTVERDFLLALYANTNGANWSNKSGWSTPTTVPECSWHGITCNAGDANITRINLPGNNLVGTLPTTLNDLTQLEVFSVSNNTLSGAIPSLAGLSKLFSFQVSTNALSGSIPSFAGLTALSSVGLHNNQLSGSIPALAGSPPLNFFTAYNNQLTGPIPSLTGLTNLAFFYVDRNQLSGTIPSLAGLVKLEVFYVQDNVLTGSLPSLSGLAKLDTFYAYNNQLSSAIPAFTGQTTLRNYDVSDNQLTGAIPSLADLSALRSFRVHDNLLTGAVPAVPTTNVLTAGGSRLCPNPLTPSINTAWNIATGSTPWSVDCGTPFTVSQTPTLDFGPVGVGNGSVRQNVVLTNTSAVAGSVVSCGFSGANASEFLYEAPAPSFPIALTAGQTVNIPIFALPSSTGNKNALYSCTLFAFGTNVGGPTSLVATSPIPTASQPASLAFGAVTTNVPSATFNVVLTNNSAVSAILNGCTIGGSNAAEFAFAPTPIFPMFIGANASRTVPLQITATSDGQKTATLTCTPIAPTVVNGGPTTITATAATAFSNIAQSGSLVFGTVILGSSSTRNATFTNSGTPGAIAGCTFTGSNPSDFGFAPPVSFPFAMAANQVISFPIGVTATTTGFKTASLNCTATAPGTLSGGPGALAVTVANVSQTAALNFGTVAVSVPSPTQNVVLANPTSSAVSILSCAFNGTDADQFAFNPTPSFPLALGANGRSAALGVRVVATSPGEKIAQLVCVGSGVVTTSSTELAAATDRGCLDADGDGQILPHTDLLMLSRAARGLTGTAVTNGAIVGTPPRNTWALIRAYLNSRCNTNYAP
jgi:Leucine rich repeat N-terminal domain